ncbi:MAG: outer membrane lipoprotein-sorting protein [candidate division Zixibacteria bacterium]|nr:outer membrane lipoprotein-sorting protein [candidate division Zixibacteria bacterium]
MMTRKITAAILGTFVAQAVAGAAVGDDAYDIVKKSQDLVRGKTSQMKITMEIVNPDYERTMKLESWAQGDDETFLLVDAPAKEKGNTFLKVGRNLWQYIKKVDEEMKIMPTMMYRGMMGSEFTYDDMVREDSFADDYASRVQEDGAAYWEIKMVPRRGTGITYTYLLYKVKKKTYIPVYVKYYDKKGLLRQLDYSAVKSMGGRNFPTVWTMTNKRKAGRVTTVRVTYAVFDKAVDGNTFTKANLRRAGR